MNPFISSFAEVDYLASTTLYILRVFFFASLHDAAPPSIAKATRFISLVEVITWIYCIIHMLNINWWFALFHQSWILIWILIKDFLLLSCCLVILHLPWSWFLLDHHFDISMWELLAHLALWSFGMYSCLLDLICKVTIGHFWKWLILHWHLFS